MGLFAQSPIRYPAETEQSPTRGAKCGFECKVLRTLWLVGHNLQFAICVICVGKFLSKLRPKIQENLHRLFVVSKKKCIFVAKYDQNVVNDIAFLGQIPERRVVV